MGGGGGGVYLSNARSYRAGAGLIGKLAQISWGVALGCKVIGACVKELGSIGQNITGLR